LSPRTKHDEKRQRREVLEQQDPEREATVLAADLAQIGQLLERDGGR
jgi:hypothetical protein